MKFDKKFFEAEEREGFLVPELMKRAWAAEIEILEVIGDICDRHGIAYFADWGTLLGAVRHQGFIPWDDDIDIAVKRPDYNRLIPILKKELPEGIVLTGMYAEERRLQEAAFVAQMRVMADEKYWDFNSYMERFHCFPFYRIGIDIFPLDYVPKDPEISDLQKMIMQQILLLLAQKEEGFPEGGYEKQLGYVEELCNTSLVRDETLNNQLWKLYDSIMSLYTYQEADFITQYPFWIKSPRRLYKKEWYDSVVMLPFENMMVPAPEKYHEVLTLAYGDYQTPVRGGGTHDYPFYANQEDGLLRVFKERGITQSITEFCRNFAEEYQCDERGKEGLSKILE